jgi:DNA-binding CsgD family transcriptional regulator
MMNILSGVPVPRVLQYLEESLAIYAEQDDRFAMGEVLFAWGHMYLNHYLNGVNNAALILAQEYFEEALAAHQHPPSAFGTAGTNMALSDLALMQKQYHTAFEHAQASRRFYQELRIGWGLIRSLGLAGRAAYMLGRYAEARQCVLENLQFNLERGLNRKQYDTHFVIDKVLISLHLAAAVLFVEGKALSAYELLGLVAQQCHNSHFKPDPDSFFLLDRLNQELSLPFAEAVERGRSRDLESLVKELIADFTKASSISDSPPQVQDNLLSERETEIIQLIAAGLNSREAAERLVLSVTTVRWYLRQIYAKLDVHSRAELLARARLLELLA